MMKLTLKGRIAEPKAFTANSGKKGLNFSVATERREKKGEDTVLVTDWIDCTQWEKELRGLATIKKGDYVKVTGYPVSEGWLDKESGEIKTKVKCIADLVDVVDSED